MELLALVQNVFVHESCFSVELSVVLFCMKCILFTLESLVALCCSSLFSTCSFGYPATVQLIAESAVPAQKMSKPTAGIRAPCASSPTNSTPKTPKGPWRPPGESLQEHGEHEPPPGQRPRP
ncbi:hypothetical protein FQA47_018024 [Oryzias melastigma]|uniref:Uncharacterized protein n=1 Tax=Oryzias melastigma TaxID=30732 RepID=A0A834C5V2_ORYME|nr:hypothetical protein FQA47_018024 [Oryzias melastigma]